ncbi:zinc ABC transporter substrate-binding protein [Alcanivorax sp. JB21]|uniref:metal ABC transporter solute-binding protein, Zn/Mn family n=1 Tax=Alcanivorax limicola TaxID=2874102 RepID=UPI001CBB59BB|nr:zinc ABC transporter substrate-binding protein [Alcanivorax limicola]MBZ2188768.1 zinc ABC transporter substrate-binding protein [Alcanivorax limicola]
MRVLLSLILIAPLLQALPAAAETPRIVASVEPLAMLLREVLGDDARVSTLLLPQQNPHQVSFTPGQARALRDADLVIWLGPEAEPQIAQMVQRHAGAALALTDLPMIYRRDGDDGHLHTDDHDDDDGHHHADLLDPHLWLYPENMLRLAQALPDQAVLANVPDWPARLAAFDARLSDTVARQRARLEPLSERLYLSHHDPWAYFADAFGVQRPLIISHNIEASASSRRFAEIHRTMAVREVRCVMAEPEGRRALLERLCRDDCRLVEADPMGRHLASADPAAHYTALLTHLAGLFSECLGGPDAQ